jgi:hypothetical protein
VSSEELTDEADLYNSDQYAWQALQELRKHAKSYSDDYFE